MTLVERDTDGVWQESAGTDKLLFTAAAGEDPATVTVGNDSGAALPNSGGPGTGLFYILGSILILGAGTLLCRRKRLI